MKNKAGFGEYTPFTASRHGRMVRKVPLPAALACRAAIVEAKAVVGWRGPACHAAIAPKQSAGGGSTSNLEIPKRYVLLDRNRPNDRLRERVQ